MTKWVIKAYEQRTDGIEHFLTSQVVETDDVWDALVQVSDLPFADWCWREAPKPPPNPGMPTRHSASKPSPAPCPSVNDTVLMHLGCHDCGHFVMAHRKSPLGHVCSVCERFPHPCDCQ